MIRTGNGDEGNTTLGSKLFRKAHALVSYSSALDQVQCSTVALPLAWGDFKPRTLLQQLLFVLGSTIGAKKPLEYELAIQEIGILLENQIEFISNSLEPLNKFICVSETTSALHELRTKIREAEIRCVAAHDALMLEGKDLNENMIFMLKKSMKVLNIASDWVFAFAWVYSTDDRGRVDKSMILELWSESKIKSLNI